MYKIKAKRSILSGQTMYTVYADGVAIISFPTRQQAQVWIKS